MKPDDRVRLHAMQIVGEAANKVSVELRDQHPEIPWASIVGMPHRLVHACFDINHDILWTTATEAAPDLLTRITTLLEQCDG